MATNYCLENEMVKVTINTLGAELSSFILKKDGTEYIWQGDPEIWGRHAPLLFPIVGKLKDNTYQIKGQTYTLSQHGFARDLPFELVSATGDLCIYRLISNAETLKIYPYPFELLVSYRLDTATLSVNYTVVNTGDDVMYFSIGAHPGFNWPLVSSKESQEDYLIQFDKTETANRLCIENGLISSRQTPFLENQLSFSLSVDLFKDDALVLGGLKSKTITLKSQKTGKFVEMDITGFPYLGIWSKPGGAPFVCLEPWYGLADGVGSNHDFKSKVGIQKLELGQEFACAYTIKIG